MTLRPAAPDTGIVFRRTDAGAEIRASWTNTIESPRCTMLSNGEGIAIGTVEHLMAALAGAEIDNAIVELDGSGSADHGRQLRAFPVSDRVRRARRAGRGAARDQGAETGQRHRGGASAALLPDHGFSMSFEIDFDNPLIRRQDICLAFDAATFKAELSRARTFGFLDEVDRLRAAGFARGGSLDNAVVVSGDHVLNAGGLRYADEFVRHKLLDAFGDLYLAGGPIIGHFRGVRSGHAHTRRLLAALFADAEAWCYTSARSGRPISARSIGRDEMQLAGAD